MVSRFKIIFGVFFSSMELNLTTQESYFVKTPPFEVVKTHVSFKSVMIGYFLFSSNYFYFYEDANWHGISKRGGNNGF